MSPAPDDGRPLRILHVLRAPVGGLFRHVLDLTRGQIARGHQVGLITDSSTGGTQAEQSLGDLAPQLALGLLRLPMRRNPHWSDATVLAAAVGRMRSSGADVVHGHGSKGGFYARMAGFLPGQQSRIRAYTPHGGSFNYLPGSTLHKLYMSAERLLASRTDILLFESAYIGKCFERYVGDTRALKRVVLNGIGPAETTPVLPREDAADFVYVGELRSAKGIDTLLDALVEVGVRTQRIPRAVLVGSGPDHQALHARAKSLGLSDQISFPGPMPARTAFALGRSLLVPSRAESLPYIVLEGAAASVPMVATDVGGIPEIFGPYADRLIPSNDPHGLADQMIAELTRSPHKSAERAQALSRYVINRFSIDNMVEAVLSGYRDAMRARVRVQSPSPAAVTS